jgi:hypothetical protein
MRLVRRFAVLTALACALSGYAAVLTVWLGLPIEVLYAYITLLVAIVLFRTRADWTRHGR